MKKKENQLKNALAVGIEKRGEWRHLFTKSILFCALVFAFSMAFTSASAQGQNTSMVYKDWSLLGEDTAHIDISYRVVLCDMMSGPAIHLKLFNENPVLKETNFSITITNGSTGATSVTQHSIELAPAVIDAGECGVNSPYVIPVPTGYDPANISLTITF